MKRKLGACRIPEMWSSLLGLMIQNRGILCADQSPAMLKPIQKTLLLAAFVGDAVACRKSPPQSSCSLRKRRRDSSDGSWRVLGISTVGIAATLYSASVGEVSQKWWYCSQIVTQLVGYPVRLPAGGRALKQARGNLREHAAEVLDHARPGTHPED